MHQVIGSLLRIINRFYQPVESFFTNQLLKRAIAFKFYWTTLSLQTTTELLKQLEFIFNLEFLTKYSSPVENKF